MRHEGLMLNILHVADFSSLFFFLTLQIQTDHDQKSSRLEMFPLNVKTSEWARQAGGQAVEQEKQIKEPATFTHLACRETPSDVFIGRLIIMEISWSVDEVSGCEQRKGLRESRKRKSAWKRGAAALRRWDRAACDCDSSEMLLQAASRWEDETQTAEQSL